MVDADVVRPAVEQANISHILVYDFSDIFLCTLHKSVSHTGVVCFAEIALIPSTYF